MAYMKAYKHIYDYEKECRQIELCIQTYINTCVAVMTFWRALQGDALSYKCEAAAQLLS